jgi:hypothetical protein
MGEGPNATPLVAGSRLFTLGATVILNAWKVQTGRRMRCASLDQADAGRMSRKL